MNNMIPAVERAMAMLELLAAVPDGLSQAEMRDRLAISMSTAYRILQTLLERGWVRKLPGGRYVPGGGLLPLCSAVLPVWERLQPVLERTAADHEVACKLSIRRGAEQLTVLRAEPEGPVALTGRRYSRFPLIEGSVGAALLADARDPEIRELAAACPTAIPEKAAPEMVMEKCALLRKHGAVWSENNRWHIRAVSAPLRDESGLVAAAVTLVLPGGELPLPEKMRLEKILKETVQLCERMRG